VGAYATLSGVACASTTTCFAVGAYSNGSVTQKLVEQWDGVSWSIVSLPDPSGATATQLSGVTCPGPKICFAVGGAERGAGLKPLIERWNGTAWSVMSGAASANGSLAAISCASALSCMAIGGAIERYDGAKWTLVSGADPDASLYAVACPSSSSCFAVGETTGSGLYGTSKTLTEHWDGTTWMVVPNPNPANAQTAVLFGVSCGSDTACVAVGNSSLASPDDDFRPTSTLVEQWDGTAWSIVDSENPAVPAFPR